MCSSDLSVSSETLHFLNLFLCGKFFGEKNPSLAKTIPDITEEGQKKHLTSMLNFRYTFESNVGIWIKALMGRSKSMNLKEREIHRLRDFPKLSRLKVAPELLD